jgi:hypothetical protein
MLFQLLALSLVDQRGQQYFTDSSQSSDFRRDLLEVDQFLFLRYLEIPGVLGALCLIRRLKTTAIFYRWLGIIILLATYSMADRFLRCLEIPGVFQTSGALCLIRRLKTQYFTDGWE